MSMLGRRTVADVGFLLLLLVWAAFVAWLSMTGVLELLPI